MGKQETGDVALQCKVWQPKFKSWDSGKGEGGSWLCPLTSTCTLCVHQPPFPLVTKLVIHQPENPEFTLVYIARHNDHAFVDSTQEAGAGRFSLSSRLAWSYTVSYRPARAIVGPCLKNKEFVRCIGVEILHRMILWRLDISSRDWEMAQS